MDFRERLYQEFLIPCDIQRKHDFRTHIRHKDVFDDSI